MPAPVLPPTATDHLPHHTPARAQARARRGALHRAARLLTLALAGSLVPAWAAGPAMLRLSLLDGEAQVLQGSQWGGAVQGQTLAAGSLLDTGPRTGLLRVEWPDQTALDLGPDTRVMLLPAGFRARQGKLPLAYVLRGWVKLSSGGQAAAGGLLTPKLELLPLAGAGSAAVLLVQAGATQVFAENTATEVLVRATGASHGLPPGAWFDAEPPALPRPAGAWLSQVPRAFRDAIPRRAAQYDGQKLNSTPLPQPAYSVLAEWLVLAEPELRRQWPSRLAPWLQDAAFRRAVQNGLPRHPEWARALEPAR